MFKKLWKKVRKNIKDNIASHIATFIVGAVIAVLGTVATTGGSILTLPAKVDALTNEYQQVETLLNTQNELNQKQAIFNAQQQVINQSIQNDLGEIKSYILDHK